MNDANLGKAGEKSSHAPFFELDRPSKKLYRVVSNIRTLVLEEVIQIESLLKQSSYNTFALRSNGNVVEFAANGPVPSAPHDLAILRLVKSVDNRGKNMLFAIGKNGYVWSIDNLSQLKHITASMERWLELSGCFVLKLVDGKIRVFGKELGESGLVVHYEQQPLNSMQIVKDNVGNPSLFFALDIAGSVFACSFKNQKSVVKIAENSTWLRPLKWIDGKSALLCMTVNGKVQLIQNYRTVFDAQNAQQSASAVRSGTFFFTPTKDLNSKQLVRVRTDGTAETFEIDGRFLGSLKDRVWAIDHSNRVMRWNNEANQWDHIGQSFLTFDGKHIFRDKSEIDGEESEVLMFTREGGLSSTGGPVRNIVSASGTR